MPRGTSCPPMISNEGKNTSLVSNTILLLLTMKLLEQSHFLSQVHYALTFFQILKTLRRLGVLGVMSLVYGGYWIVKTMLGKALERYFTSEKQEALEKFLLEKGQTDQTTLAEVAVMIYYTPDFKKYARDPISRIKIQIMFANCVMVENEIPVRFNILGIKELEGFVEDRNSSKRLRKFRDAKKDLLKTADIGILMTGTRSAIANGMSFEGPSQKEHVPQIAWVYPEDELTFLHEVGHIFGCEHNREEKNGGNQVP